MDRGNLDLKKVTDLFLEGKRVIIYLSWENSCRQAEFKNLKAMRKKQLLYSSIRGLNSTVR